MTIFLLTFIFFACSMLIMMLGIMNGRAPLRGSCGGSSADGKCHTCQGNAAHCPTNKKQQHG